MADPAAVDGFEETLAITIEPGADVETVTIALSGELDRSNEIEARQVVERLLRRGITCLIFDLARLHFMDSSGIGLLARAYHCLMERHGNLALVSPQGAVCRLLEVARVSSIVPVYPTVQQAIADLYRAPHHPI